MMVHNMCTIVERSNNTTEQGMNMNTETTKSILAAMEEITNSNLREPLIGFEFNRQSGRGDRTILFEISASDINGKLIESEIEDQIDYHDFAFDSVQILNEEEWSRGTYGYKYLNTWGKISKVLIEQGDEQNGKYVIVNHYENTATEIELEWKEFRFESMLNPVYGTDKSIYEAIGKVRKATDLTIHFVPAFHSWEVEEWDTYPDDPGCGIYDIGILVKDKATGVVYP